MQSTKRFESKVQTEIIYLKKHFYILNNFNNAFNFGWH